MNRYIKNFITFLLSAVVVGGLTFTPMKVEGRTSNIAKTNNKQLKNNAAKIGNKQLKNNVMKADNKQLKNPIKQCKNYIIYYGYKFDNKIIEKLKTYDLVVINPLEKDADDARRKLQKAGVKVYAYTSSIEIPSTDKKIVNSISNSDKLKVNGKILTHWENNQLGDLKQKSYRTKIINKVTERIYNKGYNGVFVDTLDDLENMDYILKENKVKVSNVDDYMNKMEQAGVDFIKELKKSNPKLSIIQNRGFQLLDKGTNKFVDAVLYEDICKSKDETFYKNVKSILNRYTSNNNGVVMALPNESKYYKESKKIAQENKWLYYQTTDYESTSIVNGSIYKHK